jgi:hypothetical protein
MMWAATAFPFCWISNSHSISFGKNFLFTWGRNSFLHSY